MFLSLRLSMYFCCISLPGVFFLLSFNISLFDMFFLTRVFYIFLSLCCELSHLFTLHSNTIFSYFPSTELPLVGSLINIKQNSGTVL